MKGARRAAARERRGASWCGWSVALCCLAVALWSLCVSGNGKGLAIAMAAPATTHAPAAVAESDLDATSLASGPVVFPALVPEGEPESILGLKWDKGVPKFENAPLEGSAFRAVAWSPDGRHLATGSEAGLIRIWDAATGKELRRLDGHSGTVYSVVFSPDGKSLASASADKSVRIWDAATGKELRRLEGHSSSISSVTFSPDGKSLASASWDKSVRIWDAVTGKELRRLEGHSNSVTSVAFSPDGRSLASSSVDGTIRLWAIQSSNVAPLFVSWAGADGWTTWRENAPPEYRVLRGENGALLGRLGVDGILESVRPNTGRSPHLTARATIVKSAGQGEFGEIEVAVTNAKDATEALWIELRAPKSQDKVLPKEVALRLPPTTLRLEPGEKTKMHVGYIRHLTDNPKRGSDNVVFELRHARDGEKAIKVPVELPFRSARIIAKFGTATRSGNEVTVPVILSNTGDQITGRNLAVGAKLLLPDGRISASDFEMTFNQGIAHDKHEQFSLRVPNFDKKASKFKVELTVTEGIAAGIPSDSEEIGFAATWTSQSDWLRPRLIWLTYFAMALAAVILVAGIYYLRVYRDPIVVQVSNAPPSLLQQPLRNLPKASRALARARRLDGTLATLGINDEQWWRTLDVALPPTATVKHVTDLLGARIVTQIDDKTARIELPPLRLRFGPHVAIAVLGGPRIEPGQAQRLAKTLRDTGVTSALLVDLTQAENAHEICGEIAGFALVVLSTDSLRDLFLAKHPLRALEQEISKQRPLRELSPYRVAGGVEDATMFFGRGEELRHLADRDLQNAVLVGARQMGKSSLLKALRARLETRGDVEVRYVVLSGSDLMEPIALSLNRDVPNNIQEFQALVRSTRQRPVVWLIDEADEFARADLAQTTPRAAPLCWALRAVAEEGCAYFVLAGFWGLFRAAVFDTNSPLRNFGELMRLGPLDRDAARSLLNQPMLSLGVTVEDAVVEAILEQTGRRANLLVLAC